MNSLLDVKDLFYNKNPMLIMSYLTRQGRQYPAYGSKIAEDLGISQSGTSIILKQFRNMGILTSENIGRTLVYSMNWNNPLVRGFRIFENVLELNQLIEEIKDLCRKIILFGSCAKGEDTDNSDIDLFILVDDDNKDIVRSRISEYAIDRPMNPIMINPIEQIEFEENDKVFWNQINKGIVLWGGSDE